MEVQSIFEPSPVETPQQMIDRSLKDSRKLLILLAKKNERAENQPNFLAITDSQGKILAESSLTPEHVLGRGDTSLVLSGRTPEDGRVALKIFFQAAIGEKERFNRILAREADTYKNIDHPNIAKFLGLGEIKLSEATSIPVLIKEITPHSLEEKINSPLRPAQAAELIKSISQALQSVNEKGEIVTDLSLNNIRQRENGDWVINELGMVAKPNTSDEVGVDEKYGAPELLSVSSDETKNNLATPASEVFSLGLIVWSCLTGKQISPLDRQHKTPGEIITQDQIPDKLFQVIKKATEKSPTDRYQTPENFSRAFTEALTVEEQE